MDLWGELVRDTLERHEHEAPVPTNLVEDVRRRAALRRRQWLLSAACAVAVVAVVASIAYVAAPGGRSTQRPLVGPPDTSAPAGTQTVSFHGVELFVPRAWRLQDVRCGTPMHDTVILEGQPTTLCLVPQPKGLTVVRLTTTSTPIGRLRAAVATTSTTVDGRPARRGVGVPAGEHTRLDVLVLPRPGVVISVESPDRATARRILDGTRVTPVDDAGCVDHVTPLRPGAPAGRAHAASAVVPGHPIGAAVCLYSGDWLTRSTRLDERDMRALGRILDRLPAGVSQPGPGVGEAEEACEEDRHRGYVLHFTYASGPPVAVYVHIGGCDGLSASNGARTTTIDDRLVSFLVSAVGYDSGFPDPRRLRNQPPAGSRQP